MDEVIIVMTTLPDREAAVKLARALVERRLAACVNVLADCVSVYRWKGAIEQAGETPVLAKTRAARYGDVEAAIRELHPYDVPEILALPARAGLEDYLQWVGDETAIAIG